MKTKKSCGCIIIKEGRVLLISARNNAGILFWSFPKGNQEAGESNLETALRETKEEVGLVVSILDKNPIMVSHPIYNNTATKHIYLYLASPETNVINPQEDEIESVEWVPFIEASRRLKEYYNQAWKEALRRLSEQDYSSPK